MDMNIFQSHLSCLMRSKGAMDMFYDVSPPEPKEKTKKKKTRTVYLLIYNAVSWISIYSNHT